MNNCNNCNNCKHWDEVSASLGELWGTCTLAATRDGWHEISAIAIAVASMDSNSHSANLRTRSDFGCVSWSEGAKVRAIARPEKIVSGGQTGSDRAGLDAAVALGIPTGGFAPRGWKTENGSDPSLEFLGLVETASREYPPRTKLNAQNSDGTAWFGIESTPGGRLTLNTARQYGKATIINPTPQELREWVEVNRIKILNVAGNRASTDFGIYTRTYETIIEAFRREAENADKLQCERGISTDPDLAGETETTEEVGASPPGT